MRNEEDCIGKVPQLGKKSKKTKFHKNGPIQPDQDEATEIRLLKNTSKREKLPRYIPIEILELFDAPVVVYRDIDAPEPQT